MPSPLTKKKGKSEAGSLRFTAQEKLAKWFAEQSQADKKKIKSQFFNLVDTNGINDADTGCVEIKNASGIEGVGCRTKDEGRHTIKPFIQFKGIGTTPATNGEDKGPEVNLASFYATISGTRKHIDKSLVCSHLCHNKKCINLEHLCWEKQDINSHRNFCVEGHCTHRPKCLAKGPASLDDSDTFTLKKN